MNDKSQMLIVDSHISQKDDLPQMKGLRNSINKAGQNIPGLKQILADRQK